MTPADSWHHFNKVLYKQWSGLIPIWSTGGVYHDGPVSTGKHSHYNALQWRHNDRDGVLNHRRPDCLLKTLFRRRSKKTSKLRVTGLCEVNPPVTGGFPSQRASNAENVSIWWHHHGVWYVNRIAYILLTTISNAFSWKKDIWFSKNSVVCVLVCLRDGTPVLLQTMIWYQTRCMPLTETKAVLFADT